MVNVGSVGTSIAAQGIMGLHCRHKPSVTIIYVLN